MAGQINKIRKALKIQQSIEGFTPETGLLLSILPKLTRQSEWAAITKVKHHSYGKRSYETYRFYYPSKLLIILQEQFNDSINQLTI